MRLKIYLILISSTIISSYCFAQNGAIQGYVYYMGYKGRILFDVTCILKIKNTNNGTFLDSNAFYRIENLKINEEYIVVMSCIGFEDITKAVLLNDTVVNLNFTVNENCLYNKDMAEQDIKRGYSRLLIMGGIVPIANSKEDEEFEKKYSLVYFDFGCEGINELCLKEYNSVIADYLDSRYGKVWRKFVRKDVLFLDD